MSCKNCCSEFNPPGVPGPNPDPNMGLPLLIMAFVDTAVFSGCGYIQGCGGFASPEEYWGTSKLYFSEQQRKFGPVHILLYQTMKSAEYSGFDGKLAPTGVDVGTVPEIVKFTTQFSSEVTAEQSITGGQVLINDFETYVRDKYPCIVTSTFCYRADQVDPHVVNSYSYDPEDAINDFNDYLATPVGGKYPYEHCRPTEFYKKYRPPFRNCRVHDCLSCVKHGGCYSNPSCSGSWLYRMGYDLQKITQTSPTCRFPAG